MRNYKITDSYGRVTRAQAKNLQHALYCLPDRCGYPLKVIIDDDSVNFLKLTHVRNWKTEVLTSTK